MKTELSYIQKRHFESMTNDELRAASAEAMAQANQIALATTESADRKRQELAARVEYIGRLIVQRCARRNKEARSK